MIHNTPDITIPTDRLRTLSSELRAQSPHWADRLEQATTEQELRNLVCDLFNLSHALPSHRESANETTTLAGRITRFINENLHRGLTLKVLANFLGYSEKYCSDLFYRIMGESFSGYMRRHRVERAQSLADVGRSCYSGGVQRSVCLQPFLQTRDRTFSQGDSIPAGTLTASADGPRHAESTVASGQTNHTASLLGERECPLP